MATEKGWPENCWPTDQELADWLGRCTDEERLAFAANVIQRAQQLDAALAARRI